MSTERLREPSSPKYSKRELFFQDLKPEEIPHTLTFHQDYLDLLNENQIIADLGCGFGRFSDFLSRDKDVLITGFDINPHAIAEAERRAKANGNTKLIYEERDATNLLPVSKLSEPHRFILTANMFDHVILVGTIGVVEEIIRTKMLREAYLILRPGGTMMVAEYAVNPSQMEQYKEDEAITGEQYSRVVRDPNTGKELWYATHFTKQDLTGRLEKLGLCDIQVRESRVTAEAFKGAGIKTRLQYTVWGTKPIPAKHINRQRVKPELAEINFAELELKDDKSAVADLDTIQSLTRRQR